MDCFDELIEKVKVFDYIDDLFAVSDPKGKLIYLNQKSKNEFSIDKEKWKDFFCYNFFNCTHLENIHTFCPAKDTYSKLTRKPNIYQMNTLIGDKYFLLNCTPIYNADDRINSILHIAKDVSELVFKERKLIHFNKLLKSIRNLNQFLYLERNPDSILDQACQILTETMDYVFAGILSFLNVSSKSIYFSAKGNIQFEYKPHENAAYIFLEEKGRKHLVEFNKLPKSQKKVIVFTEEFEARKFFGIIVPISHQNEIFGYLLIFSQWQEHFIDEEIELLKELSDDIGLSLYTIKTEAEKEKIEKEIREKERFYYTLLSNLPGFVYRCRHDRYWTMQYLSDNVYNITGYKPEELIGNKVLSFNDLIHKDHQERLWVKWQIILRKREVFQDEYPIITKNGEIRWVFEQGCGFYDENGNVIALEGYIVDITDRKLLEEKLKENERKFRTIFEASSDAIFLMAADTFIDCNFATLKLFDCERKDIIGRAPYEFSPEYQPDGQLSRIKAKNFIERAYRGEELRFEWLHKTLKGKEFECEVTLNKIKIGEKVNLLAIVRDISERKKQFNEILKYAQALNSIGAAVTITDINNNIIYVNKAFESLYGYKFEEIKGKHISIIRTKESLDKSIDEDILNTITKNLTWTGEVINRNKYGRTFIVHLTASPVTSPDGKITALIGIATDLTKRLEMERALRESEEKFRILVNSIDDVVYTLDLSHRHSGVYGQLLQKWGFKEEDFLGKTAIEILGPEDGKIHIEMQEKCLKGESVLYEWSRTLGDETYYFQTQISPLRDDKGNITGVVGIGREITNLKRLEFELRKFLMIIEQIHLGVFIIDTKGIIRFVNSALANFFNMDKQNLLGKNIKEIYKDLLNEQNFSNFEKFSQAFQSGNFFSTEVEIIPKNRESRWIKITIFPLLENGRIINFIGIKEDITEQKQYVEALKKAKEKSEELNALKNYLLMNFSHEFRTPLNGIMGWSQVLMYERKEPELKTIGEIIYRSGLRLLNTVNSIIDYSKIEIGIMNILEKEFDIVDIVREIIEIQKNYYSERAIEVIFQSEFESLIVEQDEYMVRAIINNIMNNAFKFTRQGKIEVQLKKENGFVKIFVSDTGIGIPKDKIDFIWKEFYQVSQGLSREFEGQGLGLSIAKKFVEKIGGNISVESELNRGSKFTITLPSKVSKINS